MSKDKKDTTEKVQALAAVELTKEDLQNKVKELEAKVAAEEEGAMSRVCKALGIDPSDVRAKEVVEKTPEVIIRCHVPTPVRVNSTVYHGVVEVPLSTFHVIQQAIGDRRMRLLKEMTGNNYLLQELAGGGYAPKLVGSVNDTGDRIA